MKKVFLSISLLLISIVILLSCSDDETHAHGALSARLGPEMNTDLISMEVDSAEIIVNVDSILETNIIVIEVDLDSNDKINISSWASAQDNSIFVDISSITENWLLSGMIIPFSLNELSHYHIIVNYNYLGPGNGWNEK